jgi:hypothetical protein
MEIIFTQAPNEVKRAWAVLSTSGRMAGDGGIGFRFGVGAKRKSPHGAGFGIE